MSQVIKLFFSITNNICTEENSRQQIGTWCVLLFTVCIYLCNLCVILSFFVCLCFCMFVFVDHLQHYLVEPVGKKSARGFPLSHYSAGRQIAVEGTFRVCKIKPKQRFGSIFFSLHIHPHISEGGSRRVTSIIICHSYVGGWGTISATINCTRCIWKFAHTYLRPSDWHRRRNANILILKSSFYKFTWYLWI